MKWAVAVVLIIVAIGAGLFAYQQHQELVQRRARAEALATALMDMRAAISKYHGDTGKYPPSLQALVPRYLPRVPQDPITGSASWRFTTEETVTPSDDFTTASAPKPQPAIIDVHSSAPGSDTHGRAYSDY